MKIRIRCAHKENPFDKGLFDYACKFAMTDHWQKSCKKDFSWKNFIKKYNLKNEWPGWKISLL